MCTLGTPELESLAYDPSTGLLTCTSTGGPVTEVEWQMDGVVGTDFEESKIVTNTVTAAYSNTLLLNGQPDAVVGNYSCLVRNLRGSSATSQLQLNGIKEYAMMAV
jgi:hypothetical protein